MDIDPSKNGPENLLVLLNEKIHPNQLQLTDLTLGIPRAHSLPEFEAVNTAIDLYGNKVRTVIGTGTVFYHRVVLERLSSGTIVEVEEGDTIDSIFAELTDHFKLVPTECRLRLFELPYIEYGETIPIVLEAIPHSLLYTGEIKVVLTSNSVEHIRQLEDDTVRLMEDGMVRHLESRP